MIVVDANIIAYCWIEGPRTAIAQRVRLRDPEWHVPVLWRSELRSTLAGYLRQATLDLGHAVAIMTAAQNAMQGREHLVPDDAVLELAAAARLSAYDCEFIALAQSLSAALVTEDRKILRAFPDLAITMEAFVAMGGAPSQAHSSLAPYRVKPAKQKRHACDSPRRAVS